MVGRSPAEPAEPAGEAVGALAERALQRWMEQHSWHPEVPLQVQGRVLLVQEGWLPVVPWRRCSLARSRHLPTPLVLLLPALVRPLPQLQQAQHPPLAACHKLRCALRPLGQPPLLPLPCAA